MIWTLFIKNLMNPEVIHAHQERNKDNRLESALVVWKELQKSVIRSLAQIQCLLKKIQLIVFALMDQNACLVNLSPLRRERLLKEVSLMVCVRVVVRLFQRYSSSFCVYVCAECSALLS